MWRGKGIATGCLLASDGAAWRCRRECAAQGIDLLRRPERQRAELDRPESFVSRDQFVEVSPRDRNALEDLPDAE